MKLPHLQIPKLRLKWWQLAIIAIAAIGIGLVAWRVATHTSPASAAAGDTPSVRAVNSGSNGYTSTKQLKSAPRPAYAEGDIMMIFITSDYGLHTDLTVPTGFTEIGRRAFGENMLAYVVGYKIATASEPSTYDYYVPAYADNLYSVMSIKDADTTIAPSLTSRLTAGSNVSHSAPGIYPVGSNDLMLSTVTIDSSTLGSASWTPAGGMTKQADHQIGAYMSMLIASEPLTNTGATGSKTHYPSGVPNADPGIAYAISIKGTRDSATTALPDGTSASTWSGTHADIDETGLPDSTGLAAGTADVAISGDFTFQNPSLTETVDYVQLSFCAHSYTDAVGGAQDTLGVAMTINGTVQAQETVTPPYSGSGAPTSCTVYTFTYYGAWTQAQLADLQVKFTRNMLGTTGGPVKTKSDNIRIEYARVRVLSHDPFVESRPLTTTPTVRAVTSASVGSATSPKTVARPTTEQGDLLIAILGVDKGLLSQTTLPSGFTEVGWIDGFFDDVSTTTSLARAKVGVKVATASEPSSYSYSVESSANSRIDIISVQGADTSATPVVAKQMTPKSSTKHHAQSVHPPGRADLLLASVIKSPVPSGGITWTPPGDMTERSDAYVASGLSMTTASMALTSGEPTARKEFTQTTDGSYRAAAFTIAVKGVVVSSQEQSSYRFYERSNDGSTGSPLEAQDTAATVTTGSTFRLRQLIHQVEGSTATTAKYKLQAAEKASTCSASTFSELTSIFDTTPAGTVMSDDFSTQDTATWTFGAGATVTGGQLVMDIPNYGWRYMKANSAYSARGASSSIEVVQTLNERVSTEMGLTMVDSANAQNEFKLVLYNKTSLQLIERVAGVNDTTTVPYDAVNHRWWRIREAGGTVYWETSPDNGTWTIQRQKTPVLTNLTSMKPNVYAGHGGYAGDTDVGTAIFDNYSLTLTDESAIGATANDPVPGSGSVVTQRLTNNADFGVQTAIAAGENGLWEFALMADASLVDKTYCFRVVKADGSPLTTYSHYPEVSFAAAAAPGASLDQQLRGGQAVVNGEKQPFSW